MLDTLPELRCDDCIVHVCDIFEAIIGVLIGAICSLSHTNSDLFKTILLLQVTDHCAIDLDQFVIQEQLAFYSDEGVEAARRVYQEGGHSKSYAEVKLSSATTADIAKDEAITGVDDAGAEVTGKAYADYPAGTDTIWVLYTVPDVQADNVKCKVGGLPEPILDGCLAAEGSLTVGGVEYAYTYDPETDNNNARVL